MTRATYHKMRGRPLFAHDMIERQIRRKIPYLVEKAFRALHEASFGLINMLDAVKPFKEPT